MSDKKVVVARDSDGETSNAHHKQEQQQQHGDNEDHHDVLVHRTSSSSYSRDRRRDQDGDKPDTADRCDSGASSSSMKNKTTNKMAMKIEHKVEENIYEPYASEFDTFLMLGQPVDEQLTINMDGNFDEDGEFGTDDFPSKSRVDDNIGGDIHDDDDDDEEDDDDASSYESIPSSFGVNDEDDGDTAAAVPQQNQEKFLTEIDDTSDVTFFSKTHADVPLSAESGGGERNKGRGNDDSRDREPISSAPNNMQSSFIAAAAGRNKASNVAKKNTSTLGNNSFVGLGGGGKQQQQSSSQASYSSSQYAVMGKAGVRGGGSDNNNNNYNYTGTTQRAAGSSVPLSHKRISIKPASADIAHRSSIIPKTQSVVRHQSKHSVVQLQHQLTQALKSLASYKKANEQLQEAMKQSNIKENYMKFKNALVQKTEEIDRLTSENASLKQIARHQGKYLADTEREKYVHQEGSALSQDQQIEIIMEHTRKLNAKLVETQRGNRKLVSQNELLMKSNVSLKKKIRRLKSISTEVQDKLIALEEHSRVVPTSSMAMGTGGMRLDVMGGRGGGGGSSVDAEGSTVIMPLTAAEQFDPCSLSLLEAGESSVFTMPTSNQFHQCNSNNNNNNNNNPSSCLNGVVSNVDGENSILGGDGGNRGDAARFIGLSSSVFGGGGGGGDEGGVGSSSSMVHHPHFDISLVEDSAMFSRRKAKKESLESHKATISRQAKEIIKLNHTLRAVTGNSQTNVQKMSADLEKSKTEQKLLEAELKRRELYARHQITMMKELREAYEELNDHNKRLMLASDVYRRDTAVINNQPPPSARVEVPEPAPVRMATPPAAPRPPSASRRPSSSGNRSAVAKSALIIDDNDEQLCAATVAPPPSSSFSSSPSSTTTAAAAAAAATAAASAVYPTASAEERKISFEAALFGGNKTFLTTDMDTPIEDNKSHDPSVAAQKKHLPPVVVYNHAGDRETPYLVL